MTNTTTSPNMLLPIPTVSEDPGPDWATNLNACLSAIDSHNHSSGQGVQITPDGMNINADFPLNGNNLISARSLRFTPQSGNITQPADLGCLYENGVDLYYVDGSGNQVRITQGGSVTGSAGTITGLPSGTASAAFSAGTFTFESATNTPAAMNFGPATIGQQVVSGFGVTISAAVAQASNYGLSLPTALPGSTQFMTLDSSGNIGASIAVSQGITNTMLAPVNAAYADNNSIVTITSASYSDVSGLSVSLTSTGRPVEISLMPISGASNASFVRSDDGGTCSLGFDVDGALTSFTIGILSAGLSFFPTSFRLVFTPAAGAHTYKVRGKRDSGTGSSSILFGYCALYVREL